MKSSLPAALPDLAAQWADPARDAFSVTPGSGYKALWRCGLGHEWRATVYSRATGTGCPVCSGKVVLAGFNDLASQAPAFLAEWDDERLPQDVLVTSSYKAAWRCAQGHTWTAAVYRRTAEGKGCPTCKNRRVEPGFNDLASQRPDLAAEWDDDRFGPETVTAGSNSSVSWRCGSGHTWMMSPNTRASGGQGCPVCAGRQVVPGFNDFASQCPDLLKEWDDALSPETVTAHSGYYARWKCAQGHSWSARVVDRHRFGCPECNASNFVSAFEREVTGFVEGLLPDGAVQTTVRRFRSGGINELDAFVPSLGVAVEANGVFYHSERFRSPDYHRQKAQACTALGIRLIQVWQDDWAERRPIVERLLARKLGVSTEPRIAARKTTAGLVPRSEARAFLDAHHIQGAASASHYLGLRDGETVVAVMALKRTDATGHVLRLERYATSAIIPGGHSKLVSYAERALPGWERLITFADNEVSDGALYEKTGWVRDGDIKPDYRYLVGSKRAHKFNYRLARFRSDPALKYEAGKSERELAELNGLVRVWDSGKVRYRYERRSG